jgi:hypothetical protein
MDRVREILLSLEYGATQLEDDDFILHRRYLASDPGEED